MFIKEVGISPNFIHNINRLNFSLRDRVILKKQAHNNYLR